MSVAVLKRNLRDPRALLTLILHAQIWFCPPINYRWYFFLKKSQFLDSEEKLQTPIFYILPYFMSSFYIKATVGSFAICYDFGKKVVLCLLQGIAYSYWL